MGSYERIGMSVLQYVRRVGAVIFLPLRVFISACGNSIMSWSWCCNSNSLFISCGLCLSDSSSINFMICFKSILSLELITEDDMCIARVSSFITLPINSSIFIGDQSGSNNTNSDASAPWQIKLRCLESRHKYFKCQFALL